jgi:hypothetical protein
MIASGNGGIQNTRVPFRGRVVVSLVCAVLLANGVGADHALAGPGGGGGGGTVEFAWGGVFTDLYDGIKGNQGIRTNPPTIQLLSYVHGAQVIMPGSIDWVAIGTVKGKGAGGCTTHYDPGANWSGYVDREIDGVYWCANFNAEQYVAGDNPSFQILYTNTCGTTNHWVLAFGGITQFCFSNGFTQGIGLYAMIENDNGVASRDIDVKYTNLMKNLPGSGTWSNLGDTRPGHADQDYVFTYVSTTAFNVYLPPLN